MRAADEADKAPAPPSPAPRSAAHCFGFDQSASGVPCAPAPLPAPPDGGGAAGWAQVEVGEGSFACGRTADGRIYCFALPGAGENGCFPELTAENVGWQSIEASPPAPAPPPAPPGAAPPPEPPGVVLSPPPPPAAEPPVEAASGSSAPVGAIVGGVVGGLGEGSCCFNLAGFRPCCLPLQALRCVAWWHAWQGWHLRWGSLHSRPPHPGLEGLCRRPCLQQLPRCLHRAWRRPPHSLAVKSSPLPPAAQPRSSAGRAGVAAGLAARLAGAELASAGGGAPCQLQGAERRPWRLGDRRASRAWLLFKRGRHRAVHRCRASHGWSLTHAGRHALCPLRTGGPCLSPTQLVSLLPPASPQTSPPASLLQSSPASWAAPRPHRQPAVPKRRTPRRPAWRRRPPRPPGWRRPCCWAPAATPPGGSSPTRSAPRAATQTPLYPRRPQGHAGRRRAPRRLAMLPYPPRGPGRPWGMRRPGPGPPNRPGAWRPPPPAAAATRCRRGRRRRRRPPPAGGAMAPRRRSQSCRSWTCGTGWRASKVGGAGRGRAGHGRSRRRPQQAPGAMWPPHARHATPARRPATRTADLELVRPLGEGSFGKVFLARWNHALCAVKLLVPEKVGPTPLPSVLRAARRGPALTLCPALRRASHPSALGSSRSDQATASWAPSRQQRDPPLRRSCRRSFPPTGGRGACAGSSSRAPAAAPRLLRRVWSQEGYTTGRDTPPAGVGGAA